MYFNCHYTSRFREIAICAVYAAVGFGLAFVLSTYVLFGVVVQGYSMYSTIPPQSRVYGLRVPFMRGQHARGDIVIMTSPVPQRFSEPAIKRIVGLPGEEIATINGIVHINGTPFDEGYLTESIQGDFASITIPCGHFFVMGDNRNNSRDSRYWGPICASTIIGRIFMHR